MHVHHCTSLILFVLLCAVAALAQEQTVANIVDSSLHAVAEVEQAVLQKAEEQEEATEHAIISHEKAPAALEDVDEFKGGFAHVMFNMLLCTIFWSSTIALFR